MLPLLSISPFFFNFRPQAKYNNKDRVVATVRDFVMSVYDDDYKYFKGHVRDGKILISIQINVYHIFTIVNILKFNEIFFRTL